MYYFCAENIIEYNDMYVQRNTFQSPSGKEYRTTLLCESQTKLFEILNLTTSQMVPTDR